MSNFIVNTDVPNIRVVIREGDQYNINMIPTSVTTTRSGSFNTYADLAGQVVTASYALVAQTVIGSIESASWSAYAVTASYVSGAASSWDTIANKPDGLVSSSTQATTWTVATSSVATSASFTTTASYASNADLFDSRNSTTFASTGSNTFVGNQTITGSIILTGSISSVDYIDINTSATPAGAVGRLQWDDGNGTAVLGLRGGNVSLQLGQELVALVYNADTVPLVDGNIVYITGSQGNRVSVKRASAVREQGSANTLGMVTEPIAVGAEGFITLYGVVNNLNTIGLTPGTTLWLSTASGEFTQTRPEAPAHGVSVGYVERVHASVGSIYVKIDNGYELDELHNVNDTTTSASFGDLIVKSGSIWINSRQLTGSYGLTGSFDILGTISGSVTLPFGIVSSSAQASTWTVATSSVATTASFALTASYVSGAASSWDTISNKPSGLVSSSAQINTGSFSGSFTGTLVGTSSWASSASNVVSASYAPTILPSGTVSSSAQINTGSFSGSFTGVLTGTSSWASNVISASYAPTILPTGTVSSSTQASTWTVATASLALTASYVSGAASTWNSISGKPNGLVSSSLQINTGSFSGSFTGTFVGTSSWASNTVTASFATSSSRAITSSFAISSSYAPTILPTGTVSSSLQINTGSFSGSFTGTFVGTSSWAQNVLSSSYAVTSSLGVNNIVTASVANTTITFTKGDGSQFSVTVAQSGSVASSSYSTFAESAKSASFSTTSSYTVSSSYAPTILPSGTVSSSLQINTGSFSGSFTGTVTGTSSVATELVKQTISLSSSISQVFTNITSGSQHLSDGVYAISSVLNSPSLVNYRLAGTFSWHTGSVSTTDIDEIFLHRTGQSASSASIFMRTNAISGSTTFLQIGSDYNLATGSYTFTLVKLI